MTMGSLRVLFLTLLLAVAITAVVGQDYGGQCVTTGTDIVWSSNCYLPIGNYPIYNSVHITAGTTVWIFSYPNEVILQATTFTNDGTISSVGLGYDPNDANTAPGFTCSGDPTHRYSAGHAGNGFNGQAKKYYGNFMLPTHKGSPAQSQEYYWCGIGYGNGGGRVHIKASTFTNNGEIDVSTEDLGTLDGGSGGSILLECTTITAIGTLRALGAPQASAGRIAIYYTTGTFDVRTAVDTKPSTHTGGSPATVYVQTPTRKELYALGTSRTSSPSFYESTLHISEFAATAFGTSATSFHFDRIYVGELARLAFTSTADTLTIDAATTIDGSGPIYVAGTLISNDHAIANSSSPIVVLETGVATVADSLIVSRASFMMLGNMQPISTGVTMSVTVNRSPLKNGEDIQFVLGGKGSNTGVKGSYTFDKVYGISGVIGVGSDRAAGTGAQITANLVSLSGSSKISAYAQGYLAGAGPGVGAPSYDLLPGGGGGHGGTGVRLLKNPTFSDLYRKAGSYQGGDYAMNLQIAYESHNVSWGAAYGDYKQPVTLGSGGGLPGVTYDGPFELADDPHQLERAAGGGAIRLSVTEIQLSGSASIDADGGYTAESSNMAGHGAGGSIWIDQCTTLTLGGTSKITAIGGYTDVTKPTFGGGGRVSINCQTITYTGALPVDVSGAAPGTIYIVSTAFPGGKLIIDNKNRPSFLSDAKGSEEIYSLVNLTSATALPSKIAVLGGAPVLFGPQPLIANLIAALNGGGSDNTGYLLWSGTLDLTSYNELAWGVGFAMLPSSTVTLASPFVLSNSFFFFGGRITNTNLDITLNGVSSIQLGPYGSTTNLGLYKFNTVSLTGTAGCELTMRSEDGYFRAVTINDLTVSAQASINADGLGYPTNKFVSQLNGTLADTFSGTGGAHAGLPPNWKSYDGQWGYGQADNPSYCGGGGTPGSNDQMAGGAGGGIVYLSVLNSFNVNGRISANARKQGYTYGGILQDFEYSGAGGSVYVMSAYATMTGSATVTADGYNGGASGGRVVVLGSSSLPSTLTAYARGLSAGGPCGTVVLEGGSSYPERVCIVDNTAGNAINPTEVGGGFKILAINGPPLSVGLYGLVYDSNIIPQGSRKIDLHVHDMWGLDVSKYSSVTIDEWGTLVLNFTKLVVTPAYNLTINGFLRNEDYEDLSIYVEQMAFVRVGAHAFTVDQTGKRVVVVNKYFRLNELNINGTFTLDGDEQIGSCVEVEAGSVFIGYTGLFNAIGYGPFRGPKPLQIIGQNPLEIIGASHAAAGWNEMDRKNAIGSYSEPLLMGSGGLGYGGGNIHLIATNITNLGEISVNGHNGGAAGSIWIDCDRAEGYFYMTARADFFYEGVDYGSADGRVAFYYRQGDINFQQVVDAGTYYEYNKNYQSAMLFLVQRRENSSAPVAVEPRTGSVDTLFFVGQTINTATIDVYNVVTSPPQLPQKKRYHENLPAVLENWGTINIHPMGQICDFFGEDCEIDNYGDLSFVYDYDNEEDAAVFFRSGTLFNYGAISGHFLVMTGPAVLYLRTPGYFPDQGVRINGRMSGGMVLDRLMAEAGAKIIVDEILDDYLTPVRELLPSGGYITPRAYISVYGLLKLSNAKILSDGTGLGPGQIDQSGNSCVGGAGFGNGGGSDGTMSPVEDDPLNPTKMGYAPGKCGNQIVDRTVGYGGGAIRIAAREIQAEYSTISAAGLNGGGGGSVWIQAAYGYFYQTTVSANSTQPSFASVCGGGGKVAYTTSNTNSYPTASVGVTGCQNSYAHPSGSGNSTVTFSPYFFIGQTLVMNNFGGINLRFGEMTYTNWTNNIESKFYLPDTYAIHVTTLPDGNYSVVMYSYGDPDTGSVTFELKPTSYTRVKEINVTMRLYDWTVHPIRQLDLPLSLFTDVATGPWLIEELDSVDGYDASYTTYSWANENVYDFNNKYTILPGTIIADDIQYPVSTYTASDGIHLIIPEFYNSIEYSFILRYEAINTPVIAFVKAAAVITPGTVVTITGVRLEGNSSAQLLYEGEPIPVNNIVRWVYEYIIFVIPQTAPVGTVTIQVVNANYGDSNLKSFEVFARAVPDYAEYVTCTSWGDPHFVKYLGDTFHYQGYGEYVFSAINGTGSVEVQVRQVPCSTGVNCNSAVAVRSGTSVFAIYKDGLATYVNHVKTSIPFGETEIDEVLSVEKIRDYEYWVNFSHGSIQILFWGFFDVHLSVSSYYKTPSEGLCGRLDLNWRFADGFTQGYVDSQAFINAYADSWRVDEERSLFDYYDKPYEYHNYPNYTGIDNPTNTSVDHDLCALIVGEHPMAYACQNQVALAGSYYVACVQDVAATGDFTIAEKSIAAFATQCQAVSGALIDETAPILGMYSYATGLLTATVNIPTAFKVFTVDALGRQAYNSSVYVDAEADNGFSSWGFYSSCNYTGECEVTYTPNGAGTHTIDVDLYVLYRYYIPIHGSPFQLYVKDTIQCISWGDPHFTTYLGQQYDFQGFGEYVLSIVNGVEIQVRQQRCNPGVTCNYAIAVGFGDGESFGFYSDYGQVRTYVNGMETELPGEGSNGALMQRINAYQYIISIQSVTVHINFYGRLDLTITASTNGEDWNPGSMGGLCGTIYADEFYYGDDRSNEYGLYHYNDQAFLDDYANSWRVSEGRSLFVYDDDTTYEDHNPTDWTPVYNISTSNDPDIDADAPILCADLSAGGNLSVQCHLYVDPYPFYKACLYDIYATADRSQAISSIVAYATVCSQFLNQSTVYPTVSEHCYAVGDGLTPSGLPPNEPTSFIVYIVDAIGNPQTRATDVVTVNQIFESVQKKRASNIEFDISPANPTYGASEYEVTYTSPSEPGEYYFEILVNGKQIRDSPFTLTYGSLPTSPADSEVYGPGIEGSALINAKTWFIITSKNSLGNEVGTGGDDWVVDVSPAANFYGVTDLGDGTYLVEYTPTSEGPYTITITLNEESMANSPFDVNVKGLKSYLSCVSWGDPHFTMFSGRVYNFQGFGEYILANVGGVTIQVRQARCNPGVTCNFGIAAKEGSTVLSIMLKDSKPVAYSNGSIITPGTASGVNKISKGALAYQYFITFPSAVVDVRAYSTRLDLTVLVASDGSAPVQALNGGLCGKWNFYLPLPDGSDITGRYPQSVIDTFGEAWRVTQSESLFNYTDSSTYTDNNPPGWVPNYNQTAEDPDISNLADSVCSVLSSGAMVETCAPFIDPTPFHDACKFDVIRTKSAEEGQASIVAYSTLCQQLGSEDGDDPVTDFPVISDHSYADGPGLGGTLPTGMDTWFTVHPIDALGNPASGSTTTFDVSASGPTGSQISFTVTPIGGGLYNVTYTTGPSGDYNITIKVDGTSLPIYGSPYKTNVNGDCNTNASCPTGSLCIGGFCQDINECDNPTQCPAGFYCTNLYLTYNCTDVDECQNSELYSCPTGTRCQNTVGNYTCSDINECTETPNICGTGYVCDNIYGTYNCSDLNECSFPGQYPCANGTECHNAVGYYNCTLPQACEIIEEISTCDTGYECSNQTHVCIDKNECLEVLDICTNGYVCANTIGSYKCDDIDECATQGVLACGNGYICNNTIGSYECYDIDECLNTTKCAAGFKCVNLLGDYYCKDLVCPHNCSGHGVCVEGTCVCDKAYTGPGCESVSIPLDLSFNPKFPQVTVTANNIVFDISVKELRELNTLFQGVRSVPLPPLNFTLSPMNNNTWKYTASAALITNYAYSNLTITFSYYPTGFNLSYAGLNVTLPPYTLKFAAQIDYWPFSNLRNKLALVSASTVSQPADACYLPTDTVWDPNGNLVWVKNEITGTTMYGQFLQNGYADKKAVQLSNRFNYTTKEALTILPHFYEQGGLDPNFAVLVDPTVSAPKPNGNAADECLGAVKGSGKKNITTPIVATIFSVLGAALIVGAVMYFQRRKQQLATRRKLTASASRNNLLQTSASGNLQSPASYQGGGAAVNVQL